MSMNQELINQELAAGGGNSTTSFSTGTLCPKTGLWKTFDGRLEVIEYYAQNEPFRSSPSGNNKKCSWTRVTLASDGGKTSYDAVKVADGSI
ncbi:MAG TPA: hypothetical protein VFT02_12955 [Pyrinomonadaceae bacterium]|nr:hypothetical protein [Pyrinomonadaceae bacterium]